MLLSSPVNVIPFAPIFATLHAIAGRAVLQGSWKASFISDALQLRWRFQVIRELRRVLAEFLRALNELLRELGFD